MNRCSTVPAYVMVVLIAGVLFLRFAAAKGVPRLDVAAFTGGLVTVTALITWLVVTMRRTMCPQSHP